MFARKHIAHQMHTRPETTSALPPRLQEWRRIVVATLVVTGADAAFAFVVYVLIAGRFNFETLLQYIASGVAGDAAYASGWAGVGYAALGLVMHLVLAAVVVVVYAVAIAPGVRTRTLAAIVGLAYGTGVWIFMNAVVLPLGRAPQEGFLSPYYIAFLIGHALLVGLPIGLIMYGAYATASTETGHHPAVDAEPDSPASGEPPVGPAHE